MTTSNNFCGNGCNCSHQYCAKKVSLFASLSDEELMQITGLVAQVQFSKGDLIFSEGQSFDKLYILNSGSMKVFKYNKDGKEQILYILNEGEFLGDLSLLKKGVLPFSAIALEDITLCTIHKNDFDHIIKTNPNISLKVLEYAHDRIFELENLIQTVTTKDIETRLASLLLNLSKTFGEPDAENSDQVYIHLTMSREDMANFIGVTRETISRKLSYFQSQDIIEVIGNRAILIKSLAILKDLVA
ncbi:MAG TPA: Crp/Fnr family transcriptional regulator [Epulopiscium sp.]|nr:Crp/Fnr family transcriptional regulator [Candidatus Epulonipiscium sp.]